MSGRTIEISHPDKIFFPGARGDQARSRRLLPGRRRAVTARDGRPAARCCSGSPTALSGSRSSKSVCRRAHRTGSRPSRSRRRTARPRGHLSSPTWPMWSGRSTWAASGSTSGRSASDDPEHADELRIDLDPQAGRRIRRGPGGGRLCERASSTSSASSPTRRRAATGGCTSMSVCEPRMGLVRGPRGRRGSGPRARTPAARPRHGELVEGGAGTAGLRRLQPERARTRPSLGPGRPARAAGGQVSTPLSWDETASVDPDELTIATVPDRLRRLGDPWAAMAGRSPSRSQPLLEMAARDRGARPHDAPWPPAVPQTARRAEPRRAQPGPQGLRIEPWDPLQRPSAHRLPARA